MYTSRKLTYLLISCLSLFVAGTGPAGNFNPYKVLGVDRDATDDDIRKAYRKLCLKYHPDKHGSKSPKERARCEEMFKRVQKANSKIGDEQSRRQYDDESSYSQFYRRSDPYSTPYSDFFHGRQNRGSPFFADNPLDVFNLIRKQFQTPYNSFQERSFYNGRSPFNMKSIYVQKKKVPLEDLYCGTVETEFVLQDSPWKRACAALRGGSIAPLVFQALGMTFPFLFRVRWRILVALFALALYIGIPEPTTTTFTAGLKRGWKGGTKLKFQQDPGITVVFVLEEQDNRRFKREGNNLKTQVTISEQQAKDGCTIEIKTMNEDEEPIRLKLEPNQIEHYGQHVTIQGHGWPHRKDAKKRGDLIVKVMIKRKVVSNFFSL